MTMLRINEVLEKLEEEIDLGLIESIKSKMKQTLNYENNDQLYLKVNFPVQTELPVYSVKETFEDIEKMMVNELINSAYTPIKQYLRKGFGSLPMIRANYGVGIMPSIFGQNFRILENNLPWVDHVESIEDIKAIISKGIPDIKTGLGKKILETHEYYKEQLKKYPKCKEAIPVYHPDLQGPFDIAHLIWGSDIYYALYDEPELIHEFMKLITETYIMCMKEFKKGINDEYDGYCYHWSSLYKGNIVLRNDSPVNISKDAYEEFIRPYDEQILREFNSSGSIHYCGRADQWVFSMMECKGLNSLNFGEPPNLIFGTDFLDKIYDTARQNKIPFVDYDLTSKQQVEDIINSSYKSGIIYRTSVGSIEEANELYARIGGVK